MNEETENQNTAAETLIGSGINQKALEVLSAHLADPSASKLPKFEKPCCPRCGKPLPLRVRYESNPDREGMIAVCEVCQ